MAVLGKPGEVPENPGEGPMGEGAAWKSTAHELVREMSVYGNKWEILDKVVLR